MSGAGKGTGTSVLAPTLFNMPSTLNKVGQLVNLPHPTMQLPWEKLVCWVFMGFGTLELCLARHWKNWGNVAFGWFLLWLLFFTGSSSSPIKGWIEFLCSVDDPSSVWCSYPSQGHQQSGKLLPKQDVRDSFNFCLLCMCLTYASQSKTALFATLCNMHSHCGEGSLLFVTLLWLSYFV
jgi:hypothetical protein